MSNLLEYATEYLRRGWQPLPVPYRSKNPNFSDWQNLLLSENELPKQFNDNQKNIGVLLGKKSHGLMDIDLDSAEAVKIADFFLPKTESVFGRKSNPRSHRLYYSNFPKTEQFDFGERIVEIRSTGGQTIFPPSVHQCGENIEWFSDGEPPRIDSNELRHSVALLASACAVSKFWKKHLRHDLSLAVSGAFLRNGFSESETKHFIRAVCFAANDEDTQDRLNSVETTAEKLRDGENVFGFPKLAELTAQKLVETLCKWLQIESQNQNDYKIETSENRKSELAPLRATRLSEIKSEPVNWLWKPFLAIGTFTLLEGEEGIGKTFLTCALACAVASGKGLPFVVEDEHIKPSNVVLISAEDSLPHIIKPRLEMMNAPCDKIIAVDEHFTLNRDGILRLSMLLAEYEPKLVIIDPLFSFTGKINLNNDNEIRSITDELKRLAEKYQCVILGIRHIGKSKGFGDARNAGLNGIGWRASARSVLLIGKNPEDESQKALCQTKNNLTERFTKSIGFEIRAGQFFWTGESSLTKETMLSPIRSETGDEKGEKQDAMKFLLEILSDGERWSKEVFDEAKQNGISNRTLSRAKSALNIQSRKEGYKPAKWFWRLPEECQINEIGNLQTNHEKKTSYSNDLAEDCQAEIFDNLHSQNGNVPKTEGKTDLKKCSSCDLEMNLIEDGQLWFCPLGCESRKAN